MAEIFGIDHGNGNIKTKNIVFPCGLTVNTIEPKSVEKEDVIKYGDKYYMLTPTRMAYKDDKTTDENYFILTLFALVKEARERGTNLNGKDIILSIGLPPANYSLYASSFEKYFQDRSKNGITFELNRKPITCYIQRIYVSPQNLSAALTYASTLIKENRVVYCIDFGDGTVDLNAFNQGKLDPNIMISLSMGTANLRAEIISRMKQDHGLDISSATVEGILLGEKNILPDEIINHINEIKKNWLVEVTNELSRYVKDFKTTPNIFIGGGSGIFKEEIMNSDDFCINKEYRVFIDEIKANAIGYEMIAEGKEKKR